MKLIMIVVDADRGEAVEHVLRRAHVAGYTELPTVLGKGETGLKQGTRAFPGSSTMYLVAVPAPQAEAIVDELAQVQESHPSDGLAVYGFDATKML